MDADPQTYNNGESRRISEAAASRYACPGFADHLHPLQPTASPAPVHTARVTAPPRPAPRRTQTAQPRQQTHFERQVIGLEGRPGPRPQNDYVDNPHLVPKTSHHERERTTLLSGRTQVGGRSEPIFTQPQSKGLKKDKDSHPSNLTTDSTSHGDGTEGHPDSESIVCHKCGKCKCKDCTSPRELPSEWVCNKKVECSASKAVEYCTCLCCVKFIFYHSTNDDDESADEPCACRSRPHCCQRWTCMGAMSLCLPCLWFYWPLQAVLGLTTLCYDRCTRQGCQCHREKASSQNPTKRLLIESESSSA